MGFIFGFSFLVPILITAVVLFFVLRPILKMRNIGKTLAKSGTPELGTVVNVGQTGLSVNQVQQIRIDVDLHAAGQATRRVVIQQLLPLGQIPSIGDTIYVLVDPANPQTAMYAGKPKAAAAPVNAYGPPVSNPGQPHAQTEQERLDIISLSPRLREDGKLAVATILAIRPQQSPLVSFDLEIDAINAPRRKVTVTQAMFGEAYKTGERIYLLVDPDDANSIAVLPFSMTGNQHLPQGANRLDALVLGPQILHEGAKAEGTILASTQISITSPQLAAIGFTRWHLRVHIVPENGEAAYDAEQDMAFSTPEKAARLGTVGNKVPIRYDSSDPQCFVTDSIALGYPDPYESTLAALKASLASAK